MRSRGFRISVRVGAVLAMAFFALTGRYVNFSETFRGTGTRTDYFVLIACCVLLLLGVVLGALSFFGEEILNAKKLELYRRMKAADNLIAEAARDVDYKQQVVDLIGTVVEQKADHVLGQLRARRENPDLEAEPYDPWRQIEKLLIVVVEFFAHVLREETTDPDAQVFGAYFVKEDDFLVGRFSKASRDATWNATETSKRHAANFALNASPALSASVFAAREWADPLYLVADCEAADRDTRHPFRYFDLAQEQPRNKSMMVYVIKDGKDDRKLRGEFCVYANLRGFFDDKNRRIRRLCEDFMREMARRAVYEHRQIDLLDLT